MTLSDWMKNHPDRTSRIWMVPANGDAIVSIEEAEKTIKNHKALQTSVFWAGTAICGTHAGTGNIIVFLALNRDYNGNIVDADGNIVE